jgi:aryl-alcohol dehydrogenase-like predicted oxidoreductase
MSQLPIAWVLQNDDVASAITGASRPDQVAGDPRAADHRLSGETMAGIDEVLADSASLTGAVAPRVVVVA